MKNQTWIIISVIMVSSLYELKSQINSVDAQLQKKYWDYRQRLQKHFIAFDKNLNGSGLIINHLNTFTEGGTQNLTNNDIPYYTDNAGRRGVIKEADAPEQLALFFGTLALEYRLLKDEGKDTKSVLNEIYYGIQALNRLDDKAEDFLSGGSSGYQRNGFLMRSDADNQLVNHFNAQYAKTDDKKDNIKAISNDYWDPISNSERTDKKDNTMSKDHVMDILEGFLFLKKFVDNETIQPTSQEPAIRLHDEIISITNRILNYVTTVRQTTQTNLPNFKIKQKGLCTDNEIRYFTNWLIFDEINNKPVHRGNNFNLFAYPIACAAKKITGYPWDAHPVKLKIEGTLCSSWEYTSLNVDLNIGSPYDLLPSVWHGIEDEFTNLYTAISNTIHTEVCVNIPPLPQFIGLSSNQVCIHPQEVEDIINGIITKTDPVQLLLTLATISNTWSHASIVAAGDSRFFYHYDLMYSLLNNDSPIHSKQFFENILNSAPCEGPYNFDYPNLYNGQPTWDPIWHHNNRWVHATDPTNLFESISSSREEKGYFHGLDYMFLYNMYRYYYKNQISEKYSNDNSCLCNEKGKIYHNTDNISHIQLLNNIVVSRKFDAYKNINVYTKEYISSNLKISNSKNLTNETDLIVCNNSLVEVEAGGVFRNQQSMLLSDSVKIVCRPNSIINIKDNGLLDVKENTKVNIQKNGQLICGGMNAKIIIRNGGKLIVESGAFFELNQGSKLIVENGGQVIIQSDLSNPTSSVNGLLTFNQGAEIQLKGNDAVLEINGRLHIGNNASFTFTYPGSASGYIKFNRGAGVWWDNWVPNNAHITCGSNASFNLKGTSKTDKVIEINQNLLAMPKNLKSLTINNGLVEFNVPNAMLETDAVTALNNSTFVGKIINGQVLNTRGIAMFGQSVFVSSGSDYINLGTGITGALFYGNKKLTNITNCNFIGCKNAIRTIGAGILLRNNTFFNNQIAVINHDVSFNSEIKNNTINSNLPLYTELGNGAIGIYAHGSDITYEVSSNKINNQNIGLGAEGVELKLKCNDLKLNSFALLGATESKINMSTILGAGFNNAHNCNQFARFYEASYWESNMGYNSMRIANNNPCVTSIGGGSGHPTTQYCPTITDGSLINFTNYNVATGFYQLVSEYNYWKPSTNYNTDIEYNYNKLKKIYYPGGTTYDNVRLLSGTSLSNANSITCPNNAGVTNNNGNGNGNTNVNFGLISKIHPLLDNSNSINITTSSFYNKKLQKALIVSMDEMGDLKNSNKVNKAADLFTEILKYNYTIPVTNNDDKYLLEIAYQKLFACVAQLVENHSESGGNMYNMPSSLQARFNDLHEINELRLIRKASSDIDYKETTDLIYLDKAMVYRLAEDRANAISTIGFIISNIPKTGHYNLYNHWYCILSTEKDAIDGIISFEEALNRFDICFGNFVDDFNPNPINNNERFIPEASSEEDNIHFANEEMLSVYPNPSSTTLNINYDLRHYQNIELKIYDIHGKVIANHVLDNTQQLYIISDLDLQSGVYLYNISGDNKILLANKLIIIKP